MLKYDNPNPCTWREIIDEDHFAIKAMYGASRYEAIDSVKISKIDHVWYITEVYDGFYITALLATALGDMINNLNKQERKRMEEINRFQLELVFGS